MAVLAGLIVVAYLFGGVVGMVAFAAAAGLGLLPPRTGSKRVHLMGVLMVPIIVGP